MKKYFLILITGVIMSGCNSSQYVYEKMDPAMIERINELEKEESNQIISFLGKTTTDIDEGVKLDLANTGIIVETVAGNIFTAKGNRKQIANLSMKKWIVKIELSVVRPLFKN